MESFVQSHIVLFFFYQVGDMMESRIGGSSHASLGLGSLWLTHFLQVEGDSTFGQSFSSDRHHAVIASSIPWLIWLWPLPCTIMGFS